MLDGPARAGGSAVRFSRLASGAACSLLEEFSLQALHVERARRPSSSLHARSALQRSAQARRLLSAAHLASPYYYASRLGWQSHTDGQALASPRFLLVLS